MPALTRWGLAAALLAPLAALAAADAPASVFDLYAQVIVHGAPDAEAALAGQLGAISGPPLAAALAAASRLDEAPELVDWPQAAAALRTRQRAAQCSVDRVRYPQADSAEVEYRCRLPDLSALLPVYRQHPVPFNGPHRPQMAPPLATAYTRLMAHAPDRDRIVAVSFQRDGDGTAWHMRDPTPLIAVVADAFLPFFEWNEHLPDDAD